MKISCLLYVSRSTIASGNAKVELDRIVAQSASRNPTLSLTGALLFTGAHFAQVLEGPDSSLEMIMASISRDTRHDDVLIVEQAPLAKRRFEKWGLAYFGPSQFVSRHVTRLFNDALPPEHRDAADCLTELMREFCG